MSVFLKLDRGMEFLIGYVEKNIQVIISKKIYFQPPKDFVQDVSRGQLVFQI